jgi:oxygen-independent coproporphyrinogen-3 oxidase
MRRVADAIFDVVPMAKRGEFSVEIDPSEIDAPAWPRLRHQE